ncbi:MAG: VWA domain-containing protein [Anaerolineae bacterium]|nr:VWA domain-containing protein [Anaerolineae bacterium]
MGLLSPTALVFASLSIPILVMYMLRLRRRDVLVSSTLLWQRLVRDREANMPWQRLRRNLLLLLQLLILALLTLALARPFVTTRVALSGNLVILLDVSASMQATDVSPNRFEAVRRKVREIIAGLAPDDVATIIAVGSRPAVLASATRDRPLLRRVIDEAAPTNSAADWEAAFALAASLISPGHTQVVIASDGGLPDTLPSLNTQVRFVGVGSRSTNCAITALATRTGPAGSQAFLRVANFDDVDTEVLIELAADDVPFDVRRVHIPARGESSLTVTDLPYGMRVLHARLIADDSLGLDNVAWAVHRIGQSKRVLLVSRGNLFLERALSTFPDVELVRLAPDLLPSSEHEQGGYSLYVYDGVLTGTLPAGNLWLIAPPLPPTGGQLGRGWGVFTDTAITHVARDDPLLRYVDLREVHILQARAIEPPPGARVLVEAEGGPLLYVAESPERRLAVFTFSLHDSDLPLQIAFPILTANLLNWLMPTGGAAIAESVHPGDVVLLRPDIGAARILVTAPDGSQSMLPIEESTPLFAATDHPGVYRVQQLDHSGAPLSAETLFAVNLFDEEESDIKPRAVLHIGRQEVSGGMEEKGRFELWPVVATLSLGVLVVEWGVYHGASRSLIGWVRKGYEAKGAYSSRHRY